MLVLAGLVIGTIAYALLIRRRVHARRLSRDAEDSELRGLVRLFLAGK